MYQEACNEKIVMEKRLEGIDFGNALEAYLMNR